MRIVRFSVVLMAVAAAVAGENAVVQWGRVQANLQLGIGATAESEPAGRAVGILVKNRGSVTRDLPIGFDGPAGPIDNLKITALRDDGKGGEQPVFDLNALKANTTGFVIPRTLHLDPDQSHEFTFPEEQLICVVNRQDVPLKKMLEQGYSVRASFEVYGVTLTTPTWSRGK